MKKKLSVFLIACSLLMCTGCSYNFKFTPSENGNGGDIEISENVDNNTTEKKNNEVSEGTEDISTTKDVATTEIPDTEEVSTEEATTESAAQDGNLAGYDCDYITNAGVGFKCSEELKVITESDSRTDYSWNREDSLFDVSVSSDEYSTLSESIDIWKSVYEGDEGVKTQEQYETTLSGDDAWVYVVQDNNFEFYTCIVLIDAGDSVKEIKCSFDNEDGLALFDEICQSAVYLKQ